MLQYKKKEKKNTNFNAKDIHTETLNFSLFLAFKL